MTNVLVRDLDLNLHDHVDVRRLEIVAAKSEGVGRLKQPISCQFGRSQSALRSTGFGSEGVPRC